MTSKAMQRWKLLSKIVRQGHLDSTAAEYSKRNFTSFNLIQVKHTETTNTENGQMIDKTYSLDNGEEVVIREHFEQKITAEDLIGFDNTGNVCMWPAEEIMAYYCMKNLHLFSGAICEFGAGMTGLGGIVLARCLESHHEYKRLTKLLLTDGNEKSTILLNHNAVINLNTDNKTDNYIMSEKLVWDRNLVLSPSHISGFDSIICADCLFFEEYHHDLLFQIHTLLKMGSKAYLFAPARGSSLVNFISLIKTQRNTKDSSEAFDFKFDHELIENYNDVVFDIHKRNLESNADYVSNIHYPLLLILTKI